MLRSYALYVLVVRYYGATALPATVLALPHKSFAHSLLPVLVP